ncbi:MAG: hypothetical protein Q4G05_00590 [Clostridia bacterium]|nr:hypothetical protein [Clostridia bacterium]
MRKLIKNLLLVVICILVITIILIDIVYGKYSYSYDKEVINIDIKDTIPPLIKMQNIQEKYINLIKNDITIDLKLQESNICENTKLLKEDIKIKVGDEYIKSESVTLDLKDQQNTFLIYSLTLQQVPYEGEIILEIEENCIEDTFLNKNVRTEISTDIFVDNAPAVLNLIKTNVNGEVNVQINSNEALQNLEGWNLSEDKLNLTKTFISNMSYTVKIKDQAGNETDIVLDIVDALNKTNS